MSTNEPGDDGAQQKYDLEEEEEMPMAERDLADDAPWKRIQQNTFTRWCNEHLKVAKKHISSLESDLSDGLRLIALIEVLSQKRISKFNKRPTFRSMKLENVSIAIKFLEDQNIKIVSIDSTDIVDGKLKLILGLIWLLILHYSISMPMWDDEGDMDADRKKQSPKEKLLGWINGKVPDKPINNFNKDWNNAQAIGALVDAVAPGLCPDWEDWQPKDALKNATEAMKLAEDWLDVPQVLRPEDMINPAVDDLSMMTYLSAFPKAKLKPGAPLRPKSNAKKVRAYGPGLEDGNVISKPTEFTVETFGAGSGNVEVLIKDPKGNKVENTIRANKDKKQTYTVEYTAKIHGKHTITITFKGVDIPKSPYTVNIGNITSDASKCSAKGPGLEATGVILNQKTYFEIFTAGAGAGTPTVMILGPDGKEVKATMTDKGKGVYYVEYTPATVGSYKVEVKFAGAQIPGSVFNVKIAHALNSSKAFAYGRGLQPKGQRVKEECIFFVDTKEAGEAELKVQIIGPGGIDEPVKVTYNNDGLYTCKYSPYKPGRYIVNIKYGGQPIPKAPFTVNIGAEPTGPITFVRAFGPGLEKGVVGKPCDFTVETNGAVGALGFAIEGPSQAEIKCKDNGDGSCEVTYFPTVEGEYAIHVTYEEEDIPNSPFIAKVTPNPGGFDASKVKAFGPGLKPDGIEIKKRTEFTVDAKNAGKAELVIDIKDQWGNKVEAEVKDNKNGTFTVYYTPEHPLKHTVAITWGGVSIPESPFKVSVGGGPSKVKVFGPGVEQGMVKAKTPTHFTVDCKEAGKAPITVGIKSKAGVNGPKEKEIPVQVKDNNDGTYAANYTPEAPGEYAVGVKYGGTEIPQSPITVGVVPDVDVGKIQITDLQESLDVGKENSFHVDTGNAGDGELEAFLTGPDEQIVPVKVVPVESGFDVMFTPTEEGPHKLDMKYGGVPMLDKPISLEAVPKPDAQRVLADGDGLKKGFVGKPADFMIDIRNAGRGGLGVTIEGPSEAEINCEDNRDGTCSVNYTPDSPGIYTINILFDGNHIKDSPFSAKVVDPSRVKTSGPGLTNGAFMDFPCTFQVDCSEAGPYFDDEYDDEYALPVNSMVVGPDGDILKVDVKPLEEDVYQVTYFPEEEGPVTVDTIYCDQQIPDFPKKVEVQEPIDFDKILLDGAGLENAVFLECPTDFKVDAKALDKPINKDLLKTEVTTPSGKKLKPTIKDNQDQTLTCSYTPVEQGSHKVDVAFAGQPLGKSPYTTEAVPGHDASKVKAYGPGLQAGVTKKPAQFTVETKNAGKGGLGILIEGPSEPKMTCKDNKDGTASVEYLPVEPGDYAVHVTFADEAIPGSPFRPSIQDSIDASKVKAHGPGLSKDGVRANVPAKFTVDATKAGKAPLDVTVIQEKGGPEKAKIVDNKDGTFDVTYVPKTEGRCQVDIKYDNKNIPDSPFNTKVLPKSDASKVKVAGPGVQKTGVLASLPVEFTVDTREAGDAELIISITDKNGKPVKPDIKDNGDGTFTISYVPTDVGQYTVTVTYGGKNVPASPFSVKTSPTGDASKCSIMGCKSGNYEIPVRRGSLKSSESTTTTRTTTTRTTTTKETITKTVVVEEETVIKVNSRDAGKGRVTCTITGPNGQEIPDVKVIENPDGTFDIIWTCPAAGNYEVDLRFGGVSLTGGPITIFAQPGPPEDLIQPDTIQQVQAAPLQSAMPQDCRPLDLVIPVIGAGLGCISGEVKTPSGRKETPVIIENKDGTITVKYSPSETGRHELAIKYNGKDVPGSPFHFHVDELKSGNVTAYGTGLTHGISNEPCHFIINTKDAGAGGLALAIEGPSKAEIKCVDNKDGTCSVTYFPTKPGQYDIVVKFADKHIPGSPFSAQIVDKSGSRMSIGTPSDVPLKITESNLNELTATIRTPSKHEEPCALKRLNNGNIGITFTPKEIGEHLVSVKKRGQNIPNSPFKIIVGAQEVGDASKVKVTGRGIKEAEAGQTAQFLVDTRNAGYGGLGVSIEGPSKADINCEDNGDGTCLVTFTPTEPGTYNVNVHYADQLVPGSPFQVAVGGDSSELPLISETLVRPTSATPVSQVNSECELTVKIPGTDPLDMTAQVTNPAGRTVDAEIIDRPDCKYCVKFVPSMVGVHTVSVKNKGLHVPGSPFMFTVGPFGEGGAHKVHAGGPGLERGEVKQPAEFQVWTREAGPGKLGITVSGPAKAPINFVDNKDGSYMVSYVPSVPGEYQVDIKFNDKAIPDSPYRPFVVPPLGDARRCSVSSLQEHGIKANHPCSFVIQLNGAKGHLKAKCKSPSGAEIDCIVTEIDEENYAVRFLPTENGIHSVDVYFKDSPIPGSPFRIRVGTVEEVGDPGHVHAYGEGLERGKTGEKCEFIVNTCGAGAGTLGIQIDGPSKVKMDVTEIGEGYKCVYVPTHPGEYMITIKYGGPTHITGSPFKAKITGSAKGGKAGSVESAQVMVETIVKTTTTTGFQAPVFTSDASKVVSSGMGLKKSFLNKKSQFQVNCSDAGNNMLIVGIAGPKTPCEEIHVKHTFGHRYTVTYLLKEKGNYVLVVKWGDEHIPGSPFNIQCA
ncbi:filamin-B-like isoform X2 [Lytechinus variegatus]|uniref:filamin-B-like isoform X2 n=1 Tax=Lytechinus variegatus TaxID=7654 RepID=UPI001BB18877|nr:filamin-B-like isoform X2 [Lytechinus variegatus]